MAWISELLPKYCQVRQLILPGEIIGFMKIYNYK